MARPKNVHFINNLTWTHSKSSLSCSTFETSWSKLFCESNWSLYHRNHTRWSLRRAVLGEQIDLIINSNFKLISHHLLSCIHCLHQVFSSKLTLNISISLRYGSSMHFRYRSFTFIKLWVEFFVLCELEKRIGSQYLHLINFYWLNYELINCIYSDITH